MREALLLRAAVDVATRRGLRGLTPGAVARESDLPLRTVYRWCGPRKRLRAMVIKHARDSGCTAIVAEAETLQI